MIEREELTHTVILAQETRRKKGRKGLLPMTHQERLRRNTSGGKVKFSFENVELEIDAYLFDSFWYIYMSYFLNNLFFACSVSNNFCTICLR